MTHGTGNMEHHAPNIKHMALEAGRTLAHDIDMDAAPDRQGVMRVMTQSRDALTQT